MGFVTIVSGLPRSGTSMMMAMLEAGGMSVMTDSARGPDSDNPSGYYELERVRRLPDGDTGWLDRAEGRAVKVVSPLLYWLPDDHEYRILFMRRALDEVLASQERMLGRRGGGGVRPPEEEAGPTLREAFRRHLSELDAWLETRTGIRVHRVDHRRLVSDPAAELPAVGEFLGMALDLDRMAAVADPRLHRQRGPPDA